MIGQTVSHYKILEKLGEGGMGVVYKAEDTKLDRYVAIKVLSAHLSSDDEAKVRFIREAKAASALEHPNICHIHEIGETPDGQLFMAMPCYEGETIEERLERNPLGIAEILHILSQVASALSRAHDKGILHRDIKPGNVMLTDGGRHATLMDFGLAKKLDATKVTRTGMTLGTMAYMSPEQLQGAKTDHRTDIWSLGVMMYEMLTGMKPFRGDQEPVVLYSIVNKEPEPAARIRKDVPPGVENIIEKALEKDVTKRYQTAAELLSDLEEQRDRLELGIKERRMVKLRKRTRNRLLRIGLPSAILAVAVFIFLVIQPFEFEIRTRTKEAIAQENSMAILHFENVADPADEQQLARIATSLLITDLGESEYIRVLTEQRQHDILKELDKLDRKIADESVAVEVARRANVNWIVTGKILSLQPSILLTAAITHALTGELRSTQRVRGGPGEDIFAVIDMLTGEIRRDLELPESAGEEPDRAVADITTNSMDAYRYYLEGMDHFYDFRMDKATESFRKAIEYDSTYARAHFRIAVATFPSHAPGYEEAIVKAKTYSDGLPVRERLFIEGFSVFNTEGIDSAIVILEELVERFPEEKEAHYWLGIFYEHFVDNSEKAIYHFERALALDRNYEVAYNDVSRPYMRIGNTEKALWAINQYIFLVPDEANPYDTKGMLLGYMGELNRAIAVYQKAVEVDPQFYVSWESLGFMYLYNKEFENAASCFKRLKESPDTYIRSSAMNHQARTLMFQGKFKAALEALDRGITEDELEKAKGDYVADKYYLRAMIHREQRDLKRALQDIERSTAVLKRDYPEKGYFADLAKRDFQVLLFLEMEDIASADSIAVIIRDAVDKTGLACPIHPHAIALLEYEKGHIETALNVLETVTGARTPQYFFAQYSQANIYLASDQAQKAVAILEAALSRYDGWEAGEGSIVNPIVYVKAHYLLGRAYEATGKRDRAVAWYSEFLDIWKDADPDLEEVIEARERLDSLM